MLLQEKKNRKPKIRPSLFLPAAKNQSWKREGLYTVERKIPGLSRTVQKMLLVNLSKHL